MKKASWIIMLAVVLIGIVAIAATYRKTVINRDYETIETDN